MTNVELIGFLSSFASLILAIIAIMQTLYFYKQSKSVENNVSVNLEGIKTQTETLERLSSKYMDKLTSYVTESRPNDQVFMLDLIKNYSSVNTLSYGKIDENNSDHDRRMKVDYYLTIWYYIALTNYFCRSFMIKLETEDESILETLENQLNTSYDDFFYVEQQLKKHTIEEIEHSQFHHLYEPTVNLRKYITDRV